MHEIAKIRLDTEMDLILAHRRSMKLAELLGLSLSAQTTFATAVSEVSRSAIESFDGSILILMIDSDRTEKFLVASLRGPAKNMTSTSKGLEYAKKLVSKYLVSTAEDQTSLQLFFAISPATKIDYFQLDHWRDLFRNEPPISAYDELKRKNDQLQELSDRVQKSEDRYKTLTNTLPLIIFTADTKGEILYANQWLATFTGKPFKELNLDRWKAVVHPEDYAAFSILLYTTVGVGVHALKTQARLKNVNDAEYYWHQVSLTPFKNELNLVQYWIGYLVDIHAQKLVEETLKDNQELKDTQAKLQQFQDVQQSYIDELNRSNQELQQFAFVASHDLQEPVRKILYYSDSLLNSAQSETSAGQVRKINLAGIRMRSLIQDLLRFSQINRDNVKFTTVDLNRILRETLGDFDVLINEKNAIVEIDELPLLHSDEGLMRQLFSNIIGNALKYSRTDVQPHVTISSRIEGNEVALVFSDNGIGFDPKYLDQIFNLFKRLHDRKTYDGTGLGLAIARKVVELHSGRIWAESAEGTGAKFFITLPGIIN
ncbi:MAG: ATP-binding protein [Flavitalea sp.]